MDQSKQFLVPGAVLKCPYGSETCKLLADESYGAMKIGSKILMSVKAVKKEVNIEGFGICTAKEGNEEVLCISKMLLSDQWLNPITKNNMLVVQEGDEVIHRNAKILCLYGITYIQALTTGQEELLESEKKFYKHMRDIFGFDDDVIAIMLKVIYAIDEKYPNESEQTKAWMFTRLMGGFYYGDGGPDNYVEPSGFKESIKTPVKMASDQIRWGITSGFNEVNWNVVLYPRWDAVEKYRDFEKEYFINELNISEADYYKLRFQVRVQHEITSRPYEVSKENFINNEGLFYSKWKEDFSYYADSNEFDAEWERLYSKYIDNGKPIFNDFAHQEITTASNLNDDIKNGITIMKLCLGQCILSDTSKDVALVFKDLSGWYGDLILGDKKLTNDDYKADLDAVNIAERIRDNEENVIEVMNDYYEQEDFNRAMEFIRNREKISDEPIDDIKMRISLVELGELEPLQEQFLDSLIRGDNEFFYEGQ